MFLLATTTAGKKKFMTSKAQKIFNKTRLTFTNDSGKIVMVIEIYRNSETAGQRRMFKKCNSGLNCKVEHGFWFDKNTWINSKIAGF